MSATRKILVVDDDPVVGKSFDRVLTGKGYVVITASTGEEALRKLKSESYDLVYTDIKMPGMSGIEVAEQIKASQPWLPVVIVTGFGSGANEARAEAAGVSGFLHKPLNPKMIEESAESALNEPNLVAAKLSASVPMTTVIESAPVTHAVKSRFAFIKNIALFFASPFIGLAYLVAMPFVGAGALAWVVGKALIMKFPFIKTVARLCVAPFIGLVYIIALPALGIGMLAWFGAKAII